MDLKSLPPQLIAPRPVGVGLAPPATAPGEAAGPGFAEALKGAVEAANGKAVEAEHQVQSLMTGDGSVHQAMIAMQDASVAMEMVMAVRNKALEAYHEIMRMPV